MNYAIINDYRITHNLTWEEFGKQFFDETGIPWKTLYGIVVQNKTPNDRNKFKLDRWIAEHQNELEPLETVAK